MKVFTVSEANQLLPSVVPILRQIRGHYALVNASRLESAAASTGAEHGGGGMAGGTAYVTALYELGKLTSELDDLGVQLKDYDRGLIDFPTMREGRVVLLCWQLGEPEEIVWWHEAEDGFAGRRPL